MREIKFRAYDKSWEDEEYSGMRYDITDLEIIDGEITGVYIDGDYYDIKEVELMQYTGLKDKNGKEIYEGDIVRKPAKDKWEEKSYISYECWFDDRITFEYGWHFSRAKFHGNLCGGQGSMPMEWADKLEIIGNIYDNPDLLEKGVDNEYKNKI